MIKLLKIASYLSIALAASAVALTGIGLTRENKTLSDRADTLAEPTIIDQLRDIKDLPDTKKDKVSPLVTESIDFALRIDPPPPPKPPVRRTSKTQGSKTTATAKAGPIVPVITPPKNVKFKLIATCRYEDFPEKSLAMIDITSKGQEWVRQGQMVGHQEIHQINDGSIVVYQNGKENGVLVVPAKTKVSSLLKGSGGERVTATVSPQTISQPGTTARPAVRNTAASTRTATSTRPSYGRRPTSSRTATRALPARPTTEAARKATAKDASELKNVLDNMKSKGTGDGKPKEAPDMDELMKTVMKMLESSSKNKPPIEKKTNTKK